MCLSGSGPVGKQMCGMGLKTSGWVPTVQWTPARTCRLSSACCATTEVRRGNSCRNRGLSVTACQLPYSGFGALPLLLAALAPAPARTQPAPLPLAPVSPSLALPSLQDSSPASAVRMGDGFCFVFPLNPGPCPCRCCGCCRSGCWCTAGLSSSRATFPRKGSSGRAGSTRNGLPVWAGGSGALRAGPRQAETCRRAGHCRRDGQVCVPMPVMAWGI